jgi:hypothetical protein
MRSSRLILRQDLLLNPLNEVGNYRRFWEMYHDLPPDVQKQAEVAHALWQVDPWHPSLRFKKVGDSIPLYSVGVGLTYRAVGKQR